MSIALPFLFIMSIIHLKPWYSDGTSGKSGSHKEVRISTAEKSGRDSKYEGYSELSRGNDKRMEKDRKSIDNRSKDDLELEMISNLQR